MRTGYIPSPRGVLAQSPAHRFGAIPPRERVDRSLVDILPGMYGNDTVGDCTAVSMCNLARGVAHINGFELVVDPGAPLKFFGNVVGNPPDLSTVDGAMPTDVLDYQTAHGFDIGPQKLVGQWGTINPQSRSSLASAIDRLGGNWMGVILHDREMQTSGVWDVVAGRDDGPAVGGHMINGWSYDGLGDEAVVQIATWGHWQAVTWQWLAARLMEAHGIVWRPLARTDGYYNGLTVDGLATEL